MPSEVDRRAKARQEFDRRRRDPSNSTVTSGTNFDNWFSTFVATNDYGSSASSPPCDTGSSSSQDSGSSFDGGSSCSADSGGGF